jgi:hypothetical protein
MTDPGAWAGLAGVACRVPGWREAACGRGAG